MRNRFKSLFVVTTFIAGCASPEIKKDVGLDRVEETSKPDSVIHAKKYINKALNKALVATEKAYKSKPIDMFGNESGKDEVKSEDGNQCPKGHYKITSGRDKGDCVEMNW